MVSFDLVRGQASGGEKGGRPAVGETPGTGFADNDPATGSEQTLAAFGDERWPTKGSGSDQVGQGPGRRHVLHVTVPDLHTVFDVETANGAAEELGPLLPGLRQRERGLGPDTGENQCGETSARPEVDDPTRRANASGHRVALPGVHIAPGVVHMGFNGAGRNDPVALAQFER